MGDADYDKMVAGKVSSKLKKAMSLREAGGRITDREDQSLVYNRPEAVQPTMLAAGPRLHAEILSHLSEGRAT